MIAARFGLVVLLVLLAAGGRLLAADPSYWGWLLPVAGVFSAGVLAAYRMRGWTAGAVIATAVALRLVLLPLSPSLSDDAYRYMWDGSIQQDGINPYAATPTAVHALNGAHDDLLPRLNSPDFHTVYPPLSQLTFRLASAAGGEWARAYYVLKAIYVLLDLAVVWMLIQLVGPGLALLYAWNPLVLMEVAGQGHTDVIAAAFLVATLLLVRSNRPGMAGAALAAAGMAKLHPFLLAPDLVRRLGWKSAIGGGIVAIGLAAIYWTPEAIPNAASSLRLYAQYFEFNAGPYYVLKWLGGLITGGDVSKTLGPLLVLANLLAVVGITLVAARRAWPFARTAVWMLASTIVLATTVHPWYLVPLLAVVIGSGVPGWHWQALGLLSLGTYARYVDGPYGLFVALGWTAFVAIAAFTYRDALVQTALRFRARSKARLIARHVPAGTRSILDLGGAEGYVGARLQAMTGADVIVADVVDAIREPIERIVYDGRCLPLDDDSVDLVVMSYVLHHCERAGDVLSEARRVARHGVIILESVYDSQFERSLLTALDRLANRLRGDWMRRQEEHLDFRPADAWRDALESHAMSVHVDRRFGWFWHRQVILVAGTVDTA